MIASSRIRWIGIMGAALAAAAGIRGARRLNAQSASPSPSIGVLPAPAAASAARNVEVVAPLRMKMARRLDVPATLDPYEQADLHAKIAGYVAEIRVDIGDRVRAGDLLAVIDVPEMIGELAEFEAHRAARIAARAVAEARLVQARTMLDVTRSQLRRAQADLSLRGQTLRRREELFDGGVIPTEQLDETLNQHETAAADVAIAQARLDANEADVRSAEAGVASAEADVTVAEAQIEKAKTIMQYTRIVAPFDGVITQRLVDRGSFVPSAAATSRPVPMLTIQRNDVLRIYLDVPESDVPFVRPGVPVRIRPFGDAIEPLDAAVTRIASSLNPGTRTMRAEIDMPNPDGRLLPGMYAQVTLELDAQENALTLPASTLLTEAGQAYVFTVRGDRAVRTTVKIGRDDGIRVEITAGLGDDDWVVTTGKGLISDADPIRPVRKDTRS